MPAGAIVGAVVAVAIAAEAVTPVAIGLAVIATAGAVASTVGTITGDKTLSMVGNIMGAVGSIGSIASGLGAFGEAGSILGGGQGVTNAAGGGAISVTELAAPAAEVAGPAAFTPEALQALDAAQFGTDLSVDAAAATNSIGAAGEGQIVNSIAGQVQSVTPVTAEAPTIAVAEPQAPVAAIDQVASASDLAPNPVADLAVDPAQGLVNQPLAETPPPVSASEFADPVTSATPMVSNEVTPTDYMSANVADPNAGTGPIDVNGNPMGQGDLPDWGSPAGNGGPTPPQDASTAYADGTYDDGSQMWQGGDNPNAKVVNGKVGAETPAQPTANGAVSPNDAVIFAKNNPGSIRHVGSRPDSIWSDIWDFAKDNKSLVLGGMMSLGSFMSGALSPKTPAEVDALNAQAERNRAAAQLEYTQNQLMQRRLNNMRQPLPVARYGGLINMAPVTGRVA